MLIYYYLKRDFLSYNKKQKKLPQNTSVILRWLFVIPMFVLLYLLFLSWLIAYRTK